MHSRNDIRVCHIYKHQTLVARRNELTGLLLVNHTGTTRVILRYRSAG